MSFLDTGYQEEAAETPAFELLPPGDYKFRVSECLGIEITEKNQEKVSLILSVNSKKVYHYLYAGVSDKDKKPYDMISPFCRAIGIRPTATDAKNPRYWTSLEGKVGQCHIIHEIQKGGKYAGEPQHKIKYFIYPKDVGNSLTASSPARPQPVRQAAGPVGPDLDDSPDDIPFIPCVV